LKLVKGEVHLPDSRKKKVDSVTGLDGSVAYAAQQGNLKKRKKKRLITEFLYFNKDHSRKKKET